MKLVTFILTLMLAAPAAAFVLDYDGDGVSDENDNCVIHHNPSQCDADGDGVGNYCDGDFDNSGIVSPNDFNLFMEDFGTIGVHGLPTDINCNGIIGTNDALLFFELFSAGVPGPSCED